jgi:hypothetical protein
MSTTEKYEKKALIKNLEDKERSYYQAVGASTYPEFKNTIKQIINDDVAATLARFGGGQLRNGL